MKYKISELSIDLLNHFMTFPEGIKIEIVRNDIPYDSKLIKTEIVDNRTIQLTYEHESFYDVLEYKDIPTTAVVVKNINRQEDHGSSIINQSNNT